MKTFTRLVRLSAAAGLFAIVLMGHQALAAGSSSQRVESAEQLAAVTDEIDWP
ncbi:hypothetical protein ACFV0C_24980 [Streptomyces sp. NPDC059568]|uniref:hypothetical protein n=1 Tax=Streptomyces sp. NPDC059568 TaxID=3346868 RepID=UPI00368629BA